MSWQYLTGRNHKERAHPLTDLTLLHHCLILFPLLIFMHAGGENISIKLISRSDVCHKDYLQDLNSPKWQR